MKNLKKIVSIILVASMMGIFGSSIGFAESAKLDKVNYTEPENLGSPIKTSYLLNGVVGVEDGVATAYTTVAGTPGMFNVFDIQNGKLLRSFEVPNGGTFWAHTIDSQGNVYVAGYLKATLYKYSPKDKTFTDLGKVFDEAAVCQMTVDDNDNVYLGTFPNAKLVKYDPKTNKLMDLGNQLPGEKYLKSLAYSDGFLYGGGMSENPQFMKIDVKTFKKTMIPLPKTDIPIKSLYQGSRAGDRIFFYCEVQGGGLGLIYDTKAQKWLDYQIPKMQGLFATPELNGFTYYPADGYVWKYDLKTDKAEKTSQTYGTAFRGGGWATIKDNPEFPNPVFVNFFYGGDIGYIDFETKKSKLFAGQLSAVGTVITMIEPNSEGNIVCGGYMGTKAVDFDPIKKAVVREYPMGQPEMIKEYDGIVYYGGYPDADLKMFDPSKKIEAKVNPKVLFNMKAEGQSRPYAIEKVGDKICIGAIADYGIHEGAVGIYDLKTNESKIYKNLVQNQSFCGSATKDGFLYMSTTIFGGLGADPKATDAQVIKMDVNTGKIITQIAPKIEGINDPLKMIGDIEFGPDGRLWTVSDGVVFAMNADTLQVEKSKTLTKHNWNDYTFRWKPFSVEFDKNGILYCNPRSTLFAVDIETMDSKELLPKEYVNKVTMAKVMPDNTIYFTSDTEKTSVFRTTLDGAVIETPGDFKNTVSLFVDSKKAVVNGEDKELDVEAKVLNGRTLVPVRFIAESFQAKVDWNEETETVTVTKDDIEIKTTLGENKLIKNGTEIEIEVPALTFDGRTLLPLRAFADALNKKVFWDDRGLIVIGDVIPDSTKDKDFIDGMVNKLKL